MRYVVGSWVEKKLDFLKWFFPVYTSMMSNELPRLCYIDGFASSGKNRIRETDQILDGSPLISLNAQPPFANYILVESNGWYYSELVQHTSDYIRYANVQIFFDDCNQLIPELLARTPPETRILVFLDPEGVQELLWNTVEELGRRGKVDLLITFSCMGVARCSQNPSTERTLDRFFGSLQWREVARKRKSQKLSAAQARRAFLELYKSQLKRHFAYAEDLIFVQTEKGKALYYLILATQDKTLMDLVKRYKSCIHTST